MNLIILKQTIVTVIICTIIYRVAFVLEYDYPIIAICIMVTAVNITLLPSRLISLAVKKDSCCKK